MSHVHDSFALVQSILLAHGSIHETNRDLPGHATNRDLEPGEFRTVRDSSQNDTASGPGHRRLLAAKVPTMAVMGGYMWVTHVVTWWLHGLGDWEEASNGYVPSH